MKTKVIITIVLLLITILLFAVKLPFLTISSKDNLIYNMFLVSTGVMFNLSYIHSVEKTPVIEKYIIGNDYSLILDSIIFESQGAGLPFDYPGVNFSVHEGKFIFEKINHPLKEILIIPHEISRNSLGIYRKQINLWVLNNNTSACIIKVENIYLASITLRFMNKILHHLW